MFTPQEVSEKVFPKASFGGGGYNMASVDEFLDALTEDYTALFKDNVTLKAKLKVLAEKVEEYRSTEEAMRQALLTAQKMAAKLVQEAQTEKEKILSDARAEAQAEIRRRASGGGAEAAGRPGQNGGLHPPQRRAVPGPQRLPAVPAGAGFHPGAAAGGPRREAPGGRGVRHRAGHPQQVHRHAGGQDRDSRRHR